MVIIIVIDEYFLIEQYYVLHYSKSHTFLTEVLKVTGYSLLINYS